MEEIEVPDQRNGYGRRESSTKVTLPVPVEYWAKYKAISSYNRKMHFAKMKTASICVLCV